MRLRLEIICLLAMVSACSKPVEMSAAGYADLTLWPPIENEPVESVMIAGVPAADIRTEADGSVTVLAQGSPNAGIQDISWTFGDGSTFTQRKAVEVIGREEPLLRRVVAIGASLTMGVQAGIPVRRGQLHAPTLQVAQALDAFHPIPLLIDPLFDPIEVDDFAGPPNCRAPNVNGHIASQVPQLVTRLAEKTGQATYNSALETPGLTVHNYAFGGATVGALADGVEPGRIDQRVTGGLIFGGDITFGGNPEGNQLDAIRELEPSLILNADFYGNDIIGAIVTPSGIRPANLTSESRLRNNIERVTADLASMGAEVFLPNLPDPTLLPTTWETAADEIDKTRAAAIARGDDPDEAEAAVQKDIERRLDIILDRWQAATEALETEAAKYDNVHVVDLAGLVESMRADGPTLNGQRISVDRLGGLLSTDDLHFSDTGYAIVAQALLDEIERVTGVSAEPIDLAAVHAGDPYREEALVERGLDLEACTFQNE